MVGSSIRDLSNWPVRFLTEEAFNILKLGRAQGSARNIGPSACLPREVKTMHALCLHLPYLEGLLPLLGDVETTPSSLRTELFLHLPRKAAVAAYTHYSYRIQ